MVGFGEVKAIKDGQRREKSFKEAWVLLVVLPVVLIHSKNRDGCEKLYRYSHLYRDDTSIKINKK